MGIKNLNTLLRKKCPEIFREVSLSEYSYKKIAIDISLYLYKYKIIYGVDWLGCFINLVVCLRKHDVHCLFVYDSKPPIEKQKELESRKDSREKLREKADVLEKGIIEYETTGEISECLDKFKALLPGVINISKAREEAKKIRSQVIEISPADLDRTREVFSILGVPFITADFEAETTCSHLCVNGLVDAVLSEDTDVLAYGTPRFLSKLDTSSGTCVEIKFEEVLEGLDLSYPQFRDLCIMSGTDYNKNIPNIGVVKAYGFIQRFGDLEGVEGELDTSVLNFRRVRELFAIPEIDTRIPFCSPPDFQELERFISEKNIKMRISYLQQTLKPKKILFEE